MPQRMKDAGKNAGKDQAAARETAIAALGFLAGDEERLFRFVGESGIDPGLIRQAAGDPGFLAGVLDHLVGDEERLLAFCGACGLKPEMVMRHHRALGGGWERDVP
jgi:hypothetical protein